MVSAIFYGRIFSFDLKVSVRIADRSCTVDRNLSYLRLYN
jgi:hypothetical protein